MALPINPPEYSKVELRKRHRCDYCDGMIEVDEVAYLYSGPTRNGTPTNFCFCEVCCLEAGQSQIEHFIREST